MYCKIFIEVTKTSPHESINENAFQVLNRTHNQYDSPMFCKILTEVTKTIVDVLQDLYRSHKDITTRVNQRECFSSSQQNSQPIKFADVLQVLSGRHKDNRQCIARS